MRETCPFRTEQESILTANFDEQILPRACQDCIAERFNRTPEQFFPDEDLKEETGVIADFLADDSRPSVTYQWERQDNGYTLLIRRWGNTYLRGGEEIAWVLGGERQIVLECKEL